MKFSDYGFRPLYKNFCVFPLNDAIKAVVSGKAGAETATGVLTYGFVDHEAGNTLELLGFAKKDEKGNYSFAPFADSARMMIRVKSVIDEEFEFVGKSDSPLANNFKNKIEKLGMYDINEDISVIRNTTFLDEFRYDYNADDVRVILFKEGKKLEGAVVKTEARGAGVILGTLLTEPKQRLGVHAGDKISFFVNEMPDGKKQLIVDLNPPKKIKAEELAGGIMLKEAIARFVANKGRETLYEVLEILRDSKVFVPYVTDSGSDMAAEVLFNRDDQTFYPVFSSEEEMKEYGDEYTKCEQSFVDSIEKASNKDVKIAGIVINPFDGENAMVIPVSMFELITGLDSRIE